MTCSLPWKAIFSGQKSTKPSFGLIIAAEQDRITPVPIAMKTREKYKAVSTYKEYRDHGHYVLGEPGWENIAQDIQEWLKQLGIQ